MSAFLSSLSPSVILFPIATVPAAAPLSVSGVTSQLLGPIPDNTSQELATVPGSGPPLLWGNLQNNHCPFPPLPTGIPNVVLQEFRLGEA